MAKTKNGNKPGRPKKVAPREDTEVNESSVERLRMADDSLLDSITGKWKNVLDQFTYLISPSVGRDAGAPLSTVIEKWNQLNPFLQNQRIKNLTTQAASYAKNDISTFVSSPGSHERELRGLSWSTSSSQQIYYNILRRSCDIPVYNHYLIPDLFETDGEYRKDDFLAEDGFIHDWIDTFDVPNTFKTIAMEVKREGKASYLLRNKTSGVGKSRRTDFCTLQKLPTDWIKITGRGQLGYTVSFDMMYFMQMGNSPEFFGEFIEQAWKDMVDTGIVAVSSDKTKYEFNPGRVSYVDDDGILHDYAFEYQGKSYRAALESTTIAKSKAYRAGRGDVRYMFWLQMPYDICYTFGSDNSHPWMAPDTMGLMLKMQELTDYCQLAGLIASTPLTAVLTGEIEPIEKARAGKNESIFDPELIRGMQDKFNALTSTNVEAFLWPAKNIKLQQLSSDVNSSEIISTATSNFLESAGEGGLTIATEKPNVAQIVVAKLLAASQQNYVTIQFERAMNFILKHKLGLKFRWKIRIWGDIFNQENDRKFLKEIVANGNIALLPKLMSAEGLSIRDTKALTSYVKSLGFYDDFMTYTQLKSAELAQEAAQAAADDESDGPGRPAIDDADVDNESTAASKAQGTNTSEGRASAE